jgi:transcriptional regulator with XRE-family HTH domain
VPRKPKDENDQLAKAIGERLTSALERQGLSVTDLHKRTGISRTVLLAYTRGNYAPGSRELKLICEQLDVTPTMLLFGSNEISASAYRFGDLRLSSDAARGLVFMTVVGSLTSSEQDAVMTLVESILIARSPEKHREMVITVQGMLESEFGHQLTTGLAEAVEKTLGPHAEEMNAEVQRRLAEDKKK